MGGVLPKGVSFCPHEGGASRSLDDVYRDLLATTSSSTTYCCPPTTPSYPDLLLER
jgi:hypothetical protein